MAKNVLIRHVAEKAGVSLSTVSMVINEKPSVSVETVRRVRQAIDDLGYNARRPAGRVLPSGRTRRTNRIALCMLKNQRSLLANSIYSDVLAGIEESLGENGLMLVHLSVNESQNFLSTVNKYGFDGIILMGVMDLPDESVLKVVWKYPCVKVLGVSIPQSRWFDQVLVDHQAVVRLAGQYLVDQGHRHCAYLGRQRKHPDSFTTRSELFAKFMASHGRQVDLITDNDLVHITHEAQVIRHDLMERLIDRLLALPDRPTGLMVDSDTIVSAVYQHLLMRGIRPGVDMDIVSCNNERSIIGSLYPSPAVVDIQAHAIGIKSAEQLMWRIDHRGEPKVTTVIEPKMVLPSRKFETNVQSMS